MLRKLGIGLLIAVAAYAAWSWIYPSVTYRYRITVEIEADGKAHSGSSVVQVTYEFPPEWLLSNSSFVPKVKGEAVFIDLGGGRNLIALLAAGPNASNVNYPYYIVPNLFGVGLREQELAQLSRLQGSREVPTDRLPTFVTFSDLSDSKTARVIEPYQFPDVFGEGVKFRGATIEMTRDGATRGIGQKMPVIMAELREQAKVSHIRRSGDPFRVSSGQFERGW